MFFLEPTHLRYMRAVILAVTFSVLSACHSGPRLVKESEMQNHAKVMSLAHSAVVTRMNLDPHVTTVALIGVNSTRGTHGSNKSGVRVSGDPLGITQIKNQVKDTIETAQNAHDMAKLTSCRALEAAFDSMVPALDRADVHAIAVTDTLEKDDYTRILERRGTLVCAAKQARGSMIRLIGLRMRAQKPGKGKGLAEYQQDLVALMNEAGVDGLLISFLSVNDMTANASEMILLAKQPDGSVEAVWQGSLKADLLKFQPVVAKPHEEDERMQNVARVYQHEFELLAAKLATDMKK